MATSSGNRTSSQQGTKSVPSSDDSLYNVGNAFDEREFIFKLLSEKRTLLAALHNEKKEKFKWKEEYERKVEECEKLGRHEDVAPTSSCVAGSLGTRISTLSLHKESDSETKALYRKLREKDEKIQQLEGKIDSLLNQVAVLKSEVIRLAGSVSKLDSQLDTELLKEQLALYEEDFKKEKDDKVNAQDKLSILEEQLRDNQEIISHFTVEIDMYKKAYEREKREKEKTLLRTFQQGNSNANSRNSSDSTGIRPPRRPQALPKPYHQVVYPVSNSNDEQDEVRRRQQLRRAGVLTRDVQRSTTHLNSDDIDAQRIWWSS